MMLAVHAGAMDALGFLALQAFTSVQTGNMVLVGLGLSTGDARQAFNAGAAIAMFSVGCVVGARIAGRPAPGDSVWPRSVTRALLVQLVCMCVFAIGWWLTDSDPGATAKVVFLVLNSFGMGIQSAAVTRFGATGLSSTYFTGMLTTTMVRVAHEGSTPPLRKNLSLLGAVIVGAAAGGLLATYVPWATPVLQLTFLGGAIVGAHVLLDRRAPV